MLKIVSSSHFKIDLKTAKKRGMNLSLLSEVVTLLAEEEKLPEKYRDHSLTGLMKEYRECHILPDRLLIYRIDSDELLLMLFRTGSHSDLVK